jgi:hypothetical protein
MLTGRLPFVHENMEKLLAAHVKDAPPRFHRIGCAQIRPAVEAVVQLALSKYPNERQQSARELAAAFGKAIGENVWEQATPPGGSQGHKTAVVVHTPPPPRPADSPIDRYQVTHRFEASMPERLAAAKIRGFVEDVDATVLASEPGLIRLRVGLPSGYQATPATGSTLLNWIATLRRPSVEVGKEPIEVELQMERPDPTQSRLCVVVACRPVKEYMPKDPGLWQTRCHKLSMMLRQYMGA